MQFVTASLTAVFMSPSSSSVGSSCAAKAAAAARAKPSFTLRLGKSSFMSVSYTHLMLYYIKGDVK